MVPDPAGLLGMTILRDHFVADNAYRRAEQGQVFVKHPHHFC
jgi:hypothetical protein